MTGKRIRLLLNAALVITTVAAVAVWAGVAEADGVAFSITGHVTDTAGAPIENVKVDLYRNTLPDHPWSSAVDGVSTDANGDYAISYPNGNWQNNGTDDPGYSGTYAVRFLGPGVGTDDGYYRPQWWNGVQGYRAYPIWEWDWQAANIATDFDVPASGTTMTNVNAVLEPYKGTIDCTVLDARTGKPIPNVGVTLFHYDTVTVDDLPYQQDQVYTDANGRFTYSADPTLVANSWWTLLFERAGYVKTWLGGVAYKAGVDDDSTQSAQAGVTHFQVASSEPSTITIKLLVPAKVSRPAVSPSRPSHGKRATFIAKLTPAAAALSGTSKLRLWHHETKRVNGKKVAYWHLRSTLKMKGSSTGKLTGSVKLAYKGKWEASVTRPGAFGYTAATSPIRTFTVR